MKKYMLLAIFMFLLLIACIICAFYSGGLAALKYSSTDTGMLTWHTFPDLISQLSHKEKYKKIVAVAWLGFVLPLLCWLAFLVVMIIGLLPKKILYGDARLANDRDLQGSGFFPDNRQSQKYPPVIIGKANKGKYKNKYIYFFGQQFLILYAPTRSGKGVGIVIPNCINYPDSLVVLDIKLENYFLSAGWRKKCGQEVYLFCPGGYAETASEFKSGHILSHRWNPLDCVSRSSLQRQTDLRKIAAIIYPSHHGENDMWNSTAINLFIALGLYLLDKEAYYRRSNTRELYRFIVSISEMLKISVPESGDLSKWMQQEIEKGDVISEETIWFFRQFMSAPEKTRGSIISVFTTELTLFSNPVTAAATNGSDFDIRLVRKKKMTIYLGLSPDTLVSHAKLVNLFFSMLISENTRELPEQNPDLKYQCLIALDEFVSMGRVEIIQKSVAFTAGYNLRFLFILQNKGQIEDHKMYGREGAETFIENTGVELFYPPKTINDMAETISKKIGMRDEKVKKKSTSSGQGTSRTVNYEVMERAALLPEEIVTLRDKKNKSGNMAIREIIFSDFCRPFIADKIIYFEEPYFAKRVDYAKRHPVTIPCLFDEQKRQKIADELAACNVSPVMSKPDLEHHDTEDISG